MKKTLFSVSVALLAMSSIVLASPAQNAQMTCPSLTDVQQVASLVKDGAYASDYYAAGDSGPVYRIYADASPSLPASITSWMDNHQKNGDKPLLVLRIQKQQTNVIHWLSSPIVVTYHSKEKHGSLKLCQYAQSGIFQMGGVFLSPQA